MMSGLVARGQQLSLEDQYTKAKSVSDDLIENLSEAATNGSIPLEELIDSYINERTEQERLEGLHESGEVSDRVYDRLTQEYDDKLSRMDEKIREGVTTLRSYHAHLRAELAKTEEELETIEAKKEAGDEETDLEDRKASLAEQSQRLRWAVAAAAHILDREAALRGEPTSRFEVSETTVTGTGSEEAGKPVVVKPSTTPASKASADAEAGKICPSCGRVTAPNTKFCVHCGSRV
jgi:chromosome segregation ATPase